MKLQLQYGTGGLDVEIPGANVTVVEPRFLPGLKDEAQSFRDAVRRPIGAPPLREVVRATDRVAVVIPDITRLLPTARLLPWLFAELAHVPAEWPAIRREGHPPNRAIFPKRPDGLIG